MIYKYKTKNMIKMKARIFILTVLVLLFTVSCEKFLEETTFNQMTPELQFESYANAQLTVNGLYIAHFHERRGQQMFWPAGWGSKNQEFSAYAASTAFDLKYSSTDMVGIRTPPPISRLLLRSRSGYPL